VLLNTLPLLLRSVAWPTQYKRGYDINTCYNDICFPYAVHHLCALHLHAFYITDIFIPSFSYRGKIVNGNNTFEEEIRERIAKGNKAFYANKALFKSNLVCRKSKLNLYWLVIKQIVVYGCETWGLKENMQRLSVFEREILRNIFGPTKEDNGIWRIKTNKELYELINHRNIKNYVKARRFSWFGRTNRMSEASNVRKIYKWKTCTSRPVGRTKSQWEDGVGNDLRDLKLIKWAGQVQDRLKWKDIVEKAKTVREL